MSGGSFNYLCTQYPPSTEELGHMLSELEALGYAQDAAEATRVMLAAVSYPTDESYQEPLRGVWRAVEWWRSCDSTETDVRQALARYRGVELPDCKRCGGCGHEPGHDLFACQDKFCEHGKDTRNIGEPGGQRAIDVVYCNYREETMERRIVPLGIRWGKTEHHPKEQWLLEVWDLDRKAARTYALRECDFHSAIW